MKRLTKKFFERSAVVVAEDLIGCFLVRKTPRGTKRFMITETEAYEGHDDLASHASRGQTERNQVMFGEAARFYIYLVYGMHFMLNIVTGKKDYPAAVLIRGLKEVYGPAKVTKLLKIDRRFNGKPAAPLSGLWFEKGESIPNKNIIFSPRIGVDYAGPIWSKKKWRFTLR